MDYNTHEVEWLYTTNAQSGAMGMQEQRIKGAYMNSKHRFWKNDSMEYNYNMRNNGQGSMKKLMVGYQPQHGQGGCPDAIKYRN